MESLLASLTYKIFLTPLLSLLHILKFRNNLKLKSRSFLIIIPISKIYCQYSIIRHTLSILCNSIFFSDVYNGSYKYWNSGNFQALFTTEHQSCWSCLLNLMKQYLTIFSKTGFEVFQGWWVGQLLIMIFKMLGRGETSYHQAKTFQKSYNLQEIQYVQNYIKLKNVQDLLRASKTKILFIKYIAI